MSILSVSLRELWQSKKRLSLPSLALMIAIASLFILQAFQTQIEIKLENESQARLGADVRLRSTHDISLQEREDWKKLLPKDSKTSFRLEFNTMLQVPNQSASQFVELNVVDNDFPLYETYELSNDFEFHMLDQEDAQMVIPYELAKLLEIKEGSVVKVGEETFEVAAILKPESSGLSGFSGLSPNVWAHERHIAATKLMERPGRVDREFLIRLPPGENSQAWAQIFEARVDSSKVRVRSAAEPRGGFQRIFDQISLFAQLVSASALLLSGFAIFGAFQNWFFERRYLIAVLRTLGARRAQINTLLLGAILLFTTTVSLLGILAGWIGFQSLVPFLSRLLGFAVASQLPFEHYIFCFFAGVSIPLVFALFAFADTQSFRPLLLLRGQIQQMSYSKEKLIIFTALVGIVFGLNIYLVKTLELAVYMSLGLFGMIFLGGAFSFIILWSISKVKWSKFLTLEYPLRTLIRERNISVLTATLFFLLSLILSFVLHMQSALIKEFSVDTSVKQSSLFIFDVGEDEKIKVEESLASVDALKINWAPWVRIRWKSINHESIESASEDDNFSREYLVSETLELGEQERLAKGKFWGKPYGGNGLPELSLTLDFAREHGIKIGDRLGFELYGIPFEALVTNFRIVRWTDFQPGFRILFQKGSFENAPFSYLASIETASSTERIAARRNLNENLPFISVVDVSKLKQDLVRILGQLTDVLIYILALLLLLGASLVAIISNEKISVRWRDFAVLRCVGARVIWLRSVLMIELFVISLMPAVFGMWMGSFSSQFVLYRYFNLESQSGSFTHFMIPLMIFLLVAVVGWWASTRLKRIRPRIVFQEA